MTKRIVPWIVFSVFLFYVGVAASGLSRRSGQAFDLAGFRRLPVSVGSRVQPIDTVARIALSRIRGSTSVPTSVSASASRSLDAVEWLLEVLAKPDAADGRPIFAVDSHEVIGKLSLKPAGPGTAYFAFRDLGGKVEAISRETQRIAKVKPADRAAWERELLVLHEKLMLYERLKNSVQPNSSLQREAKGNPVTFDLPQVLGSYRVDLMEAGRVAERRKSDKTVTLDRDTERRIRGFAAAFVGVSRVALIAAVPPHRGEARTGWNNVGAEIVNAARGGKLSQALAAYARIASGYARGDARACNEAIAAYGKWLAANGLDREADRARLEVFYNDFGPLFRAVPIYLVGLILLAAARRVPSLYSAAALLIVLAFAVHSTGILLAFRLAGRPTFLAFAGWATALCGIVIEWFSRRGLGIGVAATAASIGLAATYALAPGGAAAFVRNVADLNLLVAILATVVALAILGGSHLAATRRAAPGPSGAWNPA